MATTSAPYGLKPVTNETGYTGIRRAYTVSANVATGFFTGDIVNIGAGAATPSAATPTTTRNGYSPWGIFVGCEYTDPVAGRVFRQYLPANAVNSGYTSITIYVECDPNMLMQVQADGPVAYTDIGKNAALVNFGAGSTVTGNSKLQLGASTLNTTNTLGVKVVDIVSTPGDAYTDVLVEWNAGVHAWRNILGV